jgi:YNFM family putative membrane transporter
MLMQSAQRSTGATAHDGYRVGETGYRRITVALFAAGVATFALIYSTQALLPEFPRAFAVSAAQSTLSVSMTTIGLGVALLVAGPMSEIVGRTRLIHLSLAASTVVAVACAVAPTGRSSWACACCRGSRWPVCPRSRPRTCARNCTRARTPGPPASTSAAPRSAG